MVFCHSEMILNYYGSNCSYAMLCSKRRNPGFNCQRPDKDRAAAGSLLLFEWILFNVVFFFYDGVSAGDVDL